MKELKTVIFLKILCLLMNKLFHLLPRERTTYKYKFVFDVYAIQLRFIIRRMNESEVLTVLAVDVSESAAGMGFQFPACVTYGTYFIYNF